MILEKWYQKSDKKEQKNFLQIRRKQHEWEIWDKNGAWGSQKATETKGGVKVARGMSSEVATKGAARGQSFDTRNRDCGELKARVVLRGTQRRRKDEVSSCKEVLHVRKCISKNERWHSQQRANQTSKGKLISWPASVGIKDDL